jgi:hypothetical protein
MAIEKSASGSVVRGSALVGLIVSLGCSSPSSTADGSGGTHAGGSATNAGGSAAGGVQSAGGGAINGAGGSTASGGNASAMGGSATSSGGSNANGGFSSGSGGASSGGSVSAGANAGGSGGASMGGSGGKSAANGGKSSGGSSGSSGSGGAAGASSALAKFSFFVTSYPSMKVLAGKNEGFGGDLRFDKTDGLSGADEICRQVAERGMPGAGQKQWRAFLSVTKGPGGGPVNARDRIGTGPWYDANGRLVANNLAGLFAGARPSGDASIINDLPNEFGQPNHYVGASGQSTSTVDNHDTLTGSDTMGNLRASSAAETCNDWTSTTGTGRPWAGHSWPRSSSNGQQWASDHQVPGCAAGVDVTLGGSNGGSCVGCAGGYGGFYCFALP